METYITYKSQKLNSINTLTIVIEESFNDNFSILAHDEEGGIWIEKFADNLEQAKITAEKLYNKITKLYN
jgi:hypothetical protein